MDAIADVWRGYWPLWTYIVISGFVLYGRLKRKGLSAQSIAVFIGFHAWGWTVLLTQYILVVHVLGAEWDPWIRFVIYFGASIASVYPIMATKRWLDKVDKKLPN